MKNTQQNPNYKLLLSSFMLLKDPESVVKQIKAQCPQQIEDGTAVRYAFDANRKDLISKLLPSNHTKAFEILLSLPDCSFAIQYMELNTANGIKYKTLEDYALMNARIDILEHLTSTGLYNLSANNGSLIYQRATFFGNLDDLKALLSQHNTHEIQYQVIKSAIYSGQTHILNYLHTSDYDLRITSMENDLDMAVKREHLHTAIYLADIGKVNLESYIQARLCSPSSRLTQPIRHLLDYRNEADKLLSKLSISRSELYDIPLKDFGNNVNTPANIFSSQSSLQNQKEPEVVRVQKFEGASELANKFIALLSCFQQQGL